MAVTSSMAETLGRYNPFRYRGYFYDEETGLYYLKSRYYNPEWDRFINADVLLGKCGALLSHNLFAYCSNRPIISSDPTGCFSIKAGLNKIKAEFDEFKNKVKKWWNTPQIINNQLFWQGNLYPLYDPGDPQNAVVKIQPMPEKIASGKNSTNIFSQGDCVINYCTTFVLDENNIFAPAANAAMTIQLSVSIYQIGTLPPEAKVMFKVLGQYTDMSLGYPMQRSKESAWSTISGKTGDQYMTWYNDEYHILIDDYNIMTDLIMGTVLG